MLGVVGGIGTAVAIHYVPEFTEFQKFQVVVIVWLICAVICDSAITLSLTWHLVREMLAHLSSLAHLCVS